MTSKVTVDAHCADDVEVCIRITGSPSTYNNKDVIIKNGHSFETSFYDAMTIKVFERKA